MNRLAQALLAAALLSGAASGAAVQGVVRPEPWLCGRPPRGTPRSAGARGCVEAVPGELLSFAATTTGGGLRGVLTVTVLGTRADSVEGARRLALVARRYGCVPRWRAGAALCTAPLGTGPRAQDQLRRIRARVARAVARAVALAPGGRSGRGCPDAQMWQLETVGSAGRRRVLVWDCEGDSASVRAAGDAIAAVRAALPARTP